MEKSNRGGARPGAGRPKKEVLYAPSIRKAEKQIRDHLPQIVESMIALAKGVTVQEVTAEGETVVFTRPPDYRAGQYLMDRIMGKPKERIESENDVIIRVMYADESRAIEEGIDDAEDEQDDD